MGDGSPLLHEAVGSNVVHHRSFRYGDPETAFAEADRVVRLDWTFPRYSSTPMETYGAVAQFEPAPDRYTIWSNFQGPFILHALMCGALRVPGNRLRLVTSPQSGGSFGIKQGMYPYMVLLAAASRLSRRAAQMDRGPAGAPDRLVGGIQPGGCRRGGISRRRHADRSSNSSMSVDVGAYIRAPEPASVYRMHSASNGAYRVEQHPCRQPAGDDEPAADRPQPRLWRAAVLLRRSSARWMPARGRSASTSPRSGGAISSPATPSPTAHRRAPIYDAGDYEAGLDKALDLAGYAALCAERERAREEGTASSASVWRRRSSRPVPTWPM